MEGWNDPKQDSGCVRGFDGDRGVQKRLARRPFRAGRGFRGEPSAGGVDGLRPPRVLPGASRGAAHPDDAQREHERRLTPTPGGGSAPLTTRESGCRIASRSSPSAGDRERRMSLPKRDVGAFARTRCGIWIVHRERSGGRRFHRMSLLPSEVSAMAGCLPSVVSGKTKCQTIGRDAIVSPLQSGSIVSSSGINRRNRRDSEKLREV